MWRRFVAVAAALVVTAGLGACGDDEGGTVSGEDTGSVSSTGSGDVTRVEATFDGETLEVDESLEGGVVEFVYANEAKQPADMFLAKLDSGKSGKDFLDFTKTPEGKEQAPPFIDVSGFLSVEPGEEGTLTAVLDEGNWLIGAKEVNRGEEGEGEDGDDIVAEIKVAGGDEDAELPKTDATIEAFDFGYRLDGLEAGTQKITLSNTGKEPHIFVVFGLEPDGDLDKALAFEGEGPPPGTTEFQADLSYTDPGNAVIREVDIPKGKYGLVCFLTSPPNSEDGKPHFALGMKQEFTVS